MKKKKLAKKLGLDYDEVKDLLSENTLKSMELNEIKGGENQAVDSCCLPPPLDSICHPTIVTCV